MHRDATVGTEYSERADRSASRAVEQARMQAEAGNLDAAKNILKEALESMDASPVLHEQLGLMLYGEGDLQGSIPQLRKALQLGPLTVEGLLALVRAGMHSDDRTLAADLANEAVAAAPQDVRIVLLAAK